MKIAEKEFNELSKRLNEDADGLLKWIEAEKRINFLETQVAMFAGFMSDYLETMEGIFDTDENSLSYEHMDEYVRAAKYMRDGFGRKVNRIREMEAKMMELPCQQKLPSKDELVSMIKELLIQGENDSLTYSVCERARKMIFPFER
jgi:hypothetical protein